MDGGGLAPAEVVRRRDGSGAWTHEEMQVGASVLDWMKSWGRTPTGPPGPRRWVPGTGELGGRRRQGQFAEVSVRLNAGGELWALRAEFGTTDLLCVNRIHSVCIG